MMTPDIATRLPITQPGTSGQENNAVKSPAEQGNDLKAEFRDRMDNSVNGVQPTEAVTATNPTNTIESTQRVNRGNVPDKQDMFGQFDKIRGEFDAFLKRSGELDKAVADGKLKINDPRGGPAAPRGNADVVTLPERNAGNRDESGNRLEGCGTWDLGCEDGSFDAGLENVVHRGDAENAEEDRIATDEHRWTQIRKD